MAYDEQIVQRLERAVEGAPGLTMRKMFGGVGWMVNGNMAVGALGDGIMVRVDPAEHDELMAETGAGVFDYTGRPMRGWIHVHPEGLATEDELQTWADRGLRYAASLPPKG